MLDLFATECTTVDTVIKGDKEMGSSLEVKKNAKSNTFDKFLSIDAKAKELLGQIAWVITQRKSEYIESIINLRSHSSVAVRRKSIEALQIIADRDIIDIIKEWQNNEYDRKAWLMLESLIDKLLNTISSRNGIIKDDIKVFTVGEALFLMKQKLAYKVFEIEGELGQINTFNEGRVSYFSLKDSQDISLSAMATAGVVSRVDFPLNEGLFVRVIGSFRIGKNGRLYLEVSKINLTGKGELLRNLKKLKEKLDKEGLFEVSRKREVPELPRKILLIASAASAAITDFSKVLESRRGGLITYLLPIKTQGIGAEGEILNQLDRVNDITNHYNIDTIVITRGGGSKEDLFVFNSERVVRAVHKLNRPTIVAIGHERDNTLCELVADLRCATPSQAAEAVSLKSSAVVNSAIRTIEIIENDLKMKIEKYKVFIRNIFQSIYYYMEKRLSQNYLICQRIDIIIKDLLFSIRKSSTDSFNISSKLVQLKLHMRFRQIPSVYHLLQGLQHRNINMFSYSSTHYLNSFNRTKSKIQKIVYSTSILTSRLEKLDPKKVLERGYAMITQNDKLCSSIESIDKNEKLTIEMLDGKILSKVIKN